MKHKAGKLLLTIIKRRTLLGYAHINDVKSENDLSEKQHKASPVNVKDKYYAKSASVPGVSPRIELLGVL